MNLKEIKLAKQAEPAKEPAAEPAKQPVKKVLPQTIFDALKSRGKKRDIFIYNAF